MIDINIDDLAMHGRSEDICRWVVHTYANRPKYKDNLTVQLWVAQSRKYLDLLAEDREWDEAVAWKFRDQQ
jgi:hypothetical protein